MQEEKGLLQSEKMQNVTGSIPSSGNMEIPLRKSGAFHTYGPPSHNSRRYPQYSTQEKWPAILSFQGDYFKASKITYVKKPTLTWLNTGEGYLKFELLIDGQMFDYSRSYPKSDAEVLYEDAYALFKNFYRDYEDEQ